MTATPAFQISCAEEEDFDDLPWPHSQVNKFIAIEVFKNKILAYPIIRRFQTLHFDCQKEKEKIFRLFLDKNKKLLERWKIFSSFMLVL